MTLRKLKKIIEAKHAHAYNDAWRHVEALRSLAQAEEIDSEEVQEHKRLYFMCRAQVMVYEDLLTLIERGK